MHIPESTKTFLAHIGDTRRMQASKNKNKRPLGKITRISLARPAMQALSLRLNARLALLRNTEGLNAEMAAKRCGSCSNVIADVRHHRNVSRESLLKLAKGLAMESEGMGWLLAGIIEEEVTTRSH